MAIWLNRSVWVLGIIAVLLGCGEAAPPIAEDRSAPDSISVLTLQPSPIEVETVFDGVIEAVNQATVSAQTNGRVEALPFDIGDYVKPGEIIVKLTDREQRARLESAQASVREAQARHDEASSQFERTREIYQRKLIAKAQFDTAEANLNAAKARLESARAALREAEEGTNYTEIHAPYGGIVVERHVEVGETVAVGQALMTGLSLAQLRAAVEIPQEHVGPLRAHRKARVLLANDRAVEVTELRIPPRADSATHSFRVLAILAEGEHDLFPGTFVKVAFVSGNQSRLLIPDSAVVQRGDVRGAYVLDADRYPSLHYVQLGTRTRDGRWPVLSGLRAGDQVAVDAQQVVRFLAEAAGQ